jgi:hypothetical protein
LRYPTKEENNEIPDYPDAYRLEEVNPDNEELPVLSSILGCKKGLYEEIVCNGHHEHFVLGLKSLKFIVAHLDNYTGGLAGEIEGKVSLFFPQVLIGSCAVR